ncbi:MAG: hypothetical protein ABW207_11770, partial [Stenotrophomonas chelatiphaga]
TAHVPYGYQGDLKCCSDAKHGQWLWQAPASFQDSGLCGYILNTLPCLPMKVVLFLCAYRSRHIPEA